MSTPLSPEVEQFLRRLRAGLSTLPPEERDEVMSDVRAHMEEMQARGRAITLAEFGSPEEYAARFVAENALGGALARGTSFALGRALLVGARDSFLGLFVLVPLLLTQLVAAALVVVGLLKPFMPSRVGLFLNAQDQVRIIGLHGGDDSGLHEVLGYWAIPAFIVPGLVVLWGGNAALRALARFRLGESRKRSV